MAEMMQLIGWVSVYGPQLAAALVGVCTALIGLFLLVPGEQPEKSLQKVVDFISKFSRK